jgi:hypothetical protein
MEGETLGMSPEELEAYLERVVREQAAEAAARNGTSIEEELATVAFTAVRATASYAIYLISANNALLTRQLGELGVLPERSADNGPA